MLINSKLTKPLAWFQICLLALGLSILFTKAQAQNGKICDLVFNETPSIQAGTACLDLAALQLSHMPIKTAGNATRISKDGLRLCKSAFQVATAAEADVVFIYDNSGSMNAKFAYVDPITKDTVFHNELGGCLNTVTVGTVDFTTLLGPRSIPRLVSNTGCLYQSGDPFRSRGVVIKQALDYIQAVAPTSTAGAVGFTGPNTPPAINYLQPPISLAMAGAVDKVKNNIILDTAGATDYGPPLLQSYAWLTDPSLIKTKKQAIVFISDGGPDNLEYISSVNKDIPIYSIFLGRPTAPFAKLEELSQLTGGQFYLVNPKNVSEIHRVMSEIIKSIFIQHLPDSLVITNTSLMPPQISHATRMDMVQNADSSVSFNLDSILALRQGQNNFTVHIVAGSDPARNYSFQVDASGPVADEVTEQLKCRDQARLVVLGDQGQKLMSYASSSTQYSVELWRQSEDLASVSVAATSRDSSQPKTWDDSETLLMSASGTANGTTTVLKGNVPFNGGVATPIHGNGIWESSPDGVIALSWVHPRDPREFASYDLAASLRPVLDLFYHGERVTKVNFNQLDLEIRMVPGTGDACKGCLVQVITSGSADHEAILMSVATGYVNGHFSHQASDRAILGDGILQHYGPDSLVLIYQDPINPQITVRKSYPYTPRPNPLTLVIGRHNTLAIPLGNMNDTQAPWIVVAAPSLKVVNLEDGKSGCCGFLPWPLSHKDSIQYVGLKVEATAEFSLEAQVFDNLGHFVNKLRLNVPQIEFEKLPKGVSDSSRVMIVLWNNRAIDGSLAGTGAYVLKSTINMPRGNHTLSEARLVGLIRNEK
jgi:hypothetical protein